MGKIHILDVLKQSGQKIKENINKEFLTYLFFVLVAVIIWYLNALNKSYTADLKFTVKYTYLPEDKVLVEAPPDYLTLTINAQGFTLLKYRLGLIFSPIALETSYNTLRRELHSPQGNYYIATQSVFDRISSQLGSGVRLMQVAPDTLNFLFSETVSKQIPVKPAVQFQFVKGFLPRGNMIVEPEKVIVTGPRMIVDTMQYVHTVTKVFRNLNDTLRTIIDLQPVDRLRYSVSEAGIVQVIERYTESTVTVPVEPINLPEGFTMKVFPGTVMISCMVPVADYGKLQSHMFRAVVDYTSVKGENRAKVAIVRTPDYVTDVKFHPGNVDFIIER